MRFPLDIVEELVSGRFMREVGTGVLVLTYIVRCRRAQAGFDREDLTGASVRKRNHHATREIVRSFCKSIKRFGNQAWVQPQAVGRSDFARRLENFDAEVDANTSH